MVRAEELTPEEHVIAAEDELAAGVRAAEVAGVPLQPSDSWCRTWRIPTIQEVLGCGRSQAYQYAKRLKDKLAQLVGEGEDVRAVGLEMIRLLRRRAGPGVISGSVPGRSVRSDVGGRNGLPGRSRRENTMMTRKYRSGSLISPSRRGPHKGCPTRPCVTGSANWLI